MINQGGKKVKPPVEVRKKGLFICVCVFLFSVAIGPFVISIIGPSFHPSGLILK